MPGEEGVDPVVLVGVPLVVGSVMYGDLYAAGQITMRNGFDAFRYAQTLGLKATTATTVGLRDAFGRVRLAVEVLGPEVFAASWHLLVAYVDRVGVPRAIEELQHGRSQGVLTQREEAAYAGGCDRVWVGLTEEEQDRLDANRDPDLVVMRLTDAELERAGFAGRRLRREKHRRWETFCCSKPPGQLDLIERYAGRGCRLVEIEREPPGPRRTRLERRRARALLLGSLKLRIALLNAIPDCHSSLWLYGVP